MEEDRARHREVTQILRSLQEAKRKGPDRVSFGDFVPYTLEDLGVIVPHCSSMPNRWEWFWHQYKSSTPDEVLRNTVVVYHMDKESISTVPDEVRVVELDCKLVVNRKLGKDLTGSTLKGLNECRTRLVARLHNDVELVKPFWAKRAIDEFNKPPHLKMLGTLAAPGLPYNKARRLCYQPWVDRHLRYGEYNRSTFFTGFALIANRAVWAAYYPLVAEYTAFEREDIYFTMFARADGIEMIFFDGFFRHRGTRGRDVIK